jgi:hypothetical protein
MPFKIFGCRSESRTAYSAAQDLLQDRPNGYKHSDVISTKIKHKAHVPFKDVPLLHASLSKKHIVDCLFLYQISIY